MSSPEQLAVSSGRSTDFQAQQFAQVPAHNPPSPPFPVSCLPLAIPGQEWEERKGAESHNAVSKLQNGDEQSVSQAGWLAGLLGSNRWFFTSGTSGTSHRSLPPFLPPSPSLS